MDSRRDTQPGDAHYLHEERRLDPLLVPPIDDPRLVIGIPRSEALLVAARSGDLFEVDPVFGTRKVGKICADPIAMALIPGRLATLDRSGHLQVWKYTSLELIWEQQVATVVRTRLFWWGEQLTVQGDELSGERRLLVYDATGQIKSRIRLPPHACGALSAEQLSIVRSTEAGIQIRPVGALFPAANPTSHILSCGEDGTVFGLALGGVTVWPGGKPSPITFKFYDVVNACVSADGHWLGMGTRAGLISVVAVHSPSSVRINPPRIQGHNGLPIGMAFSVRGRWFMTIADRCRLWSYS